MLSDTPPGVSCAGSSAASGVCITCGGLISAETGSIQSVFYNEDDYPNLLFCEWNIETNTDLQVSQSVYVPLLGLYWAYAASIGPVLAHKQN